MSKLVTFWQNSGTQLLGYAQGTIAALAGASVIPGPHLKYWLAASAVLTVWRGQGNTQAIAAVVVQQHADAIATAVATNTAPVIAPPGKLAPK